MYTQEKVCLIFNSKNFLGVFMVTTTTLNASQRTLSGTGARAVRVSGAQYYLCNDKAPEMISMDPKALMANVCSRGFSAVYIRLLLTESHRKFWQTCQFHPVTDRLFMLTLCALAGAKFMFFVPRMKIRPRALSVVVF
jgi:hypothetical protein